MKKQIGKALSILLTLCMLLSCIGVTAEGFDEGIPMMILPFDEPVQGEEIPDAPEEIRETVEEVPEAAEGSESEEVPGTAGEPEEGEEEEFVPAKAVKAKRKAEGDVDGMLSQPVTSFTKDRLYVFARDYSQTWRVLSAANLNGALTIDINGNSGTFAAGCTALPAGALWKAAEADGGFALYNESTGKYLGCSGGTLSLNESAGTDYWNCGGANSVINTTVTYSGYSGNYLYYSTSSGCFKMKDSNTGDLYVFEFTKSSAPADTRSITLTAADGKTALETGESVDITAACIGFSPTSLTWSVSVDGTAPVETGGGATFSFSKSEAGTYKITAGSDTVVSNEITITVTAAKVYSNYPKGDTLEVGGKYILVTGGMALSSKTTSVSGKTLCVAEPVYFDGDGKIAFDAALDDLVWEIRQDGADGSIKLYQGGSTLLYIGNGTGASVKPQEDTVTKYFTIYCEDKKLHSVDGTTITYAALNADGYFNGQPANGSVFDFYCVASAPPAKRVVIYSDVTSLVVDGITTLTAGLSGIVVGQTVTWAAADPTKVQVPASGNPVTITALAEGATTITATADGVTSEPLTIIVEPKPATPTISGLPQSIFLISNAQDGTQKEYNLTANLSNITGEVTWKVTKGAEFVQLEVGSRTETSAAAKVTALAMGNATITVSAEGAESVSIPVSIGQLVKTITVSGSKTEITVNNTAEPESVELTAVLSGLPGKTVGAAGWKTSDPDAVTLTVDPEDGNKVKVTAKAAAENVKITAEIDGVISNEYVISVVTVTPEITIAGAKDLTLGDEAITLTAVLKGMPGQTVKWTAPKVDGKEIVKLTIDESDGNKVAVTANEVGTATIFATADGLEATCTIAVTKPEKYSEAEQFTDGRTYVIAVRSGNNWYLLGAVDGEVKAVPQSYGDGKLADTPDTVLWQARSYKDGFSLYNKAGGKYLEYCKTDIVSDTLQLNSTITNTEKYWIAIGTSGDAKIVVKPDDAESPVKVRGLNLNDQYDTTRMNEFSVTSRYDSVDVHLFKVSTDEKLITLTADKTELETNGEEASRNTKVWAALENITGDVTWSTDSDCVRVEEDYSDPNNTRKRIVSAVSEGTAAIKAEAGGVSATIVITVKTIEAELIVTSSRDELILGEPGEDTAILNATLRGLDGMIVSWTAASDDEKPIVELSATTGTSVTVTAVNPGKTTITAAAGHKVTKLEITVKAAPKYSEVKELANGGVYVIAQKSGSQWYLLDAADGKVKMTAVSEIDDIPESALWTAAANGTTGGYTLKHNATGKYLDYHNSTTAGETIQLNTTPAEADRYWTTQAAGDGINIVNKPDVEKARGLIYNDTEGGTTAANAWTITSRGAQNGHPVCLFRVTSSAEPEAKTWTVTVNEPVGGTAVLSATTAKEGTDVTLTVAAAEGYALESVKDGETDVTEQLQGNIYTIGKIAADHTLTVTFKEIPAEKFAVNFVLDGAAYGEAQEIESGKTVTMPEKPADVKETGANNEFTWTFDAWYTDAEFKTPFDAAAPITAATTVYGRYKFETVKGDVDMNGKVRGVDASMVLASQVKTYTFDPYQEQLADVSGDGKVSSIDATYILQIAAGIIGEETPVTIYK